MRWGVYVLCGFAAVWGVVGVVNSGLPAWIALVPVAVSAVIAVVTPRLAGPAIDRQRGDPERRLRVLAWASGIEGLAIFVAVNLAINLGRPDLVTAAVALIVGLHFLPLARLMPEPRYYPTAIALILVAAVAPWLTSAHRDVVVCSAAAAILWATALSYATPRRQGRVPA